MMKILITGGAGFIGSHGVIRALDLGYEVINIDKLTYAGTLKNLENYYKHPSHFFYEEDICNIKKVSNIINDHRPDAIIHMAAESHVDRSIDSPDDFVQTNICGTHSLLKASYNYFKTLQNKDGFRFIHLSTDEVFGALGLEGKFNERMPYRPNSPYAASKASGDLLVRAYVKTYGFPAITVNSSNNYGPRQYPEKLLPLIILSALNHKPLPIYGRGDQVRDWLFVEDHVDAFFSILEKGRVGESYCIGGDNERSNLNMVKTVCEILDGYRPWDKPYASLITHVEDRPGHDFRYATDSTHLKNHTQWIAKTPFEEGLQKTIEWYVNEFEGNDVGMVALERMGLAV